ncbi:hypothetical protein AAEX63_13215 [Luteococcus sp. H138]|uniref:hypothetical protein n=1 Tax=unclassified Luteococcus TaxID=2639923 RepID=UPI00313D32F6
MRRPMMVTGTLLLALLGGCSATTPAEPAGTRTSSDPGSSIPAASAPASTVPASAARASADPEVSATAGPTGSASNQSSATTVAQTKADGGVTGTSGAAHLYYISLDDGGALGCGDTAVAAIALPASNTPVRDAMTKLLANHSEELGMSGLANPIGRSHLSYVDGKYDRSTGLVTVWLEGRFSQSGTCDDPRLEAQLEMTAMSAAPGASKAQVFINGKKLESYLDMRD